MSWQSGDVRGRFAPTPSGPLHLGNLRTALIAWVAARSAGGEIVLRVEDLDPATSRAEHEQAQLQALRALGLDWDGPVMHQSLRRAEHLAALDALREMQAVYPCFCSRREIREAAHAPHAEGPEHGYPGTCRRLSPSEVQANIDAGRVPAWRVLAAGARLGYRDLVHGVSAGVCDDFVVQRNDGLVAYHVAVVVDDAAQSVTQVVRGDDLRDSTPRQRWLQDRLGLPEPEYAHVPLVLGDDGARLAKRHGAVTLDDLVQRGLTPREVLVRLGASLGWCAGDDRRPIDELLGAFVGGFVVADLPRVPWTLTRSLV
jgi:glutamyl-tRNA synthetase